MPLPVVPILMTAGQRLTGIPESGNGSCTHQIERGEHLIEALAQRGGRHNSKEPS